jgi:hypothetical protein
MIRPAVFAASLLLTPPVFADGPVNPMRAEWTEPTTNTDDTPLTDLAGYVMRLATAPTGPWLDVATVDASSPAPLPDTLATFDLRTLSLTTGQYYLAGVAVNMSGVFSAQSNTVPFEIVSDTAAPVLVWGTPTPGKNPTVVVGAHDETALRTITVFVNEKIVATASPTGTDWDMTVSLGHSKSATVRIEATDAAGNFTTGSRIFRR